jgi:hypothetical protein
MRNQGYRSEAGPRPTYEQLVTDSVILTETYVESAIKHNRSDSPNPHRAAEGMLNAFMLSLLLWVLILLPFLII